ncbi:MAG: nucleotidyl transferase AbiEii/AbiGii toxin family protein [Candidatus Liptonbacteria bacterium]|nr:nucleotidyl transferase AbiEii/AbiGii toxin family protein [Candidatus Liptonbacteria bacterium]
MHKEILTKGQTKLLPLLKSFSKEFGLVGGTAMALYVGHRQSIDFDIFTNKKFDNQKVRKMILPFGKIERAIIDEKGQYTIMVRGVRLTFLEYPFPIKFIKNLNNTIKLPDVLTLAAMKAYALGRRAKWKDYVDLYFVMKKYEGIAPIIKTAKKIFGKEFNEKFFRAQLSYFKDIDYSEEVIYQKGFKAKREIIQKALIDFSLS